MLDPWHIKHRDGHPRVVQQLQPAVCRPLHQFKPPIYKKGIHVRNMYKYIYIYNIYICYRVLFIHVRMPITVITFTFTHTLSSQMIPAVNCSQASMAAKLHSPALSRSYTCMHMLHMCMNQLISIHGQRATTKYNHYILRCRNHRGTIK